MAPRKTERLVNLVMCLLSARRHLTADQLRTLVPQYAEAPSDEAFKRMFERDKEDLRELGIPLATGSDSVWDDDPGYRVQRGDYELPEVSLEPDEAAAVGLAARVWQSASLSAAASLALAKLQAAGIETQRPFQPGLEPRVEAREPAFEPFVEAVRAHRPVTFSYRPAASARPAQRRLEPWGVVSWHGRWYAVGHDLDRGATRVFRLDRVVGDVRPAGEPGTVRPPAALDLPSLVAEYGRQTSTAGTARLRVRPGRGGDLRRDARPVGSADGWDLLALDYGDVELLADRLLEYGPDVVVDEPPLVRDAVVRRLRAMAEALGKAG